MSAPAWMPFYVADYLADTGHLSAAEHGAYMLLIMHYWQRGAIPLPIAEQARVARMTLEEWEAARPIIEAFFLPGWRHKRIDEERQKAANTMNKRSAAGKANASRRYANGKQMAARSHLGGGVGNNLGEGEPPEQEEASPRAKELDHLESELREAAGLTNSISTGLFDLSPIVKLLDNGYDLANDILPKLRAAAATGKTPSTWAYYVPSIVESKAKNAAIPPKANGTPSADVTWLDEEHPQWGVVAGRWRTEKGKPLIPTTSKHGSGFGAFVPTAWLPELTPSH